MKRIQQKFHNARGLATAALVLLLALSGFITTAQKKEQHAAARPVVKNFGKVNDNYYRGSQPTKAQLAALKAMGVRTIIDLRRDFVPEERLWATEQGMNYFNIPMKPNTAATKEQAEYFLRLVNDPANGPVFVHCRGGKHRTGAMTAIYRITHDNWTAEQAFEEMKKYDFNDNIFGGPKNQKKFVFDFYEQQKK